MEEEYPSLVERSQSTLIDAIFIIILMIIFSNILDGFSYVPDWLRIVLFIFLFIAYEPLCTSYGCTLGNYFKNMRVRKNDDSTKRISFIQAIVRYAIKILLGSISFLTIHSNLKKRAIHDMAAGSVMIKINS